ncbi:hypothetical protein SAY86_012708 [Trapa natans]|uniref:Uncharacterized protein n=1 Tax=Trapa natans TaxID=22666 RepID=A0AAN7M074_TRANT|nr:hypothetical protein SAY86_012708 [Trapa natans]
MDYYYCYHHNHHLQTHQQPYDGDDDDGFPYNSSYEFPHNRPFLPPRSDNGFPESQFSGDFDLYHGPGGIEDAPAYSNQQPVSSYMTYWSPCFDDGSRYLGGYDVYGHNHPQPVRCYASYSDYSSPVQHRVAYSVSPLYESKSFQIDPSPVASVVISYSSVDSFNAPDFEEYDPTPYSGGYDPALTYGEPLSPSDEICYPKDSAVKKDAEVPTPEAIEAPGPEKQPVENVEDDEPIVPAMEVDKNVDRHGDGAGDDLPREVPSGGSDQVSLPAPPGFGLDSLDLCESLFGYWPCLARDARRGGYGCPQEYGCGARCIQRNEWEDAANYLFGSLDPYCGGHGERYHHGISELCYSSSSSSASSSLYGQERRY